MLVAAGLGAVACAWLLSRVGEGEPLVAAAEGEEQ
jgi:hypothetical protein